jgi:hypothetical protein
MAKFILLILYIFFAFVVAICFSLDPSLGVFVTLFLMGGLFILTA